jgi:hypothetical protein
MSQSKWTTWFILSTIWLMSMFFVTMIATPNELRTMGDNFLFVFGYATCMINFIGCVYVGCQPSED